MAKRLNRVGETITNKDGITYTIIRYKADWDLDVESSLGDVRYHMSYKNFLRIKNSRLQAMIGRVGEKSISVAHDMQMTITKYHDCIDIEVQFEDGSVIEHRSYGAFKKGRIGHPKYIRSKKLFKCGDDIFYECECKACKDKHVLNLREMKDFECKQSTVK